MFCARNIFPKAQIKSSLKNFEKTLKKVLTCLFQGGILLIPWKRNHLFLRKLQNLKKFNLCLTNKPAFDIIYAAWLKKRNDLWKLSKMSIQI